MSVLMEPRSTFNCYGKVNPVDWSINPSSLFSQEIENLTGTSSNVISFSDDVLLFDNIMPRSIAALHLKHMTQLVEMRLKMLCRYEAYTILTNTATAPTDLYATRRSICEFLLYLQWYLNSIKGDVESIRNLNTVIGEDLDELFLVLKQFLERLRLIPDAVFHCIASHLGNKCKQPTFHVYHIHLELRWFTVTLAHARQSSEQDALLLDSQNNSNCLFNGNAECRNNDIDTTISTIINDLIYIAVKMFERISLSDLRTKSPYSCTCVRELWLMLQIFTNHLVLTQKSKDFWKYVNHSLDVMTDNKNSIASFMECKNPELFSLWLTYHLGILYGYNQEGNYVGAASTRIQPNYEQVEKMLKIYVNKGGKVGERDEIDQELCAMIPLLTILACDWWQPRLQVISLLWDCFHRRLDEPFLLQVTGPWCLSIDKKEPAEILKQAKQRLEGNFEQNKSSSYGMFLCLLGTFLRRNYVRNDSKYWNQIKGRIYSKFTKSKARELSEAGLYNFTSLFLTMALTADTLDVCTVMLDLLPSVLEENDDSKRRQVIWKSQLAVFILFAERQISFDKIKVNFMKEVDAVSCRKDEISRSMLTSFVETLDLLLLSSENMNLSEYCFIGGWIDRYLLECPKNKIKTLINTLSKVFSKCSQPKHSSVPANPGIRQMLEALWMHVASRVRTLVFDPLLYEDQYLSLSELAAKFTIGALEEPGLASRYKHSFVSLFQHFSTSIMIRDVRITRSYLISILQNDCAVSELKKNYKNFDVVVVQAWIRCYFMICDGGIGANDFLTRYVIRTNEIIQTFQPYSDLTVVEMSNEPIFQFIIEIMKQSQRFETEHAKLSFAVKCRRYFNNIEKWAVLPEIDDSKQSALATWVYRCIGALIYYCSAILYVKNQPNNMLLNLVNKFMLPSGKTSQVANNGKKIFSRVVLGIGRLDIKADVMLKTIIGHLFDEYLPHLIVDPSSGEKCKVSENLTKCFSVDAVDYLRVVFENLTSNFVAHRNGISDKNSFLVILLLRKLVNDGKTYGPHIFDMIISVCLPKIISCYMKVHDLHVHKQQTMCLILELTLNPYYKEDSAKRDEMKRLLANEIFKYLTTYPAVTFELLTSISKINLEVIINVLPGLESAIRQLENNRSPSATSLRFSLRRLQNSIQNVDNR